MDAVDLSVLLGTVGLLLGATSWQLAQRANRHVNAQKQYIPGFVVGACAAVSVVMAAATSSQLILASAVALAIGCVALLTASARSAK